MLLSLTVLDCFDKTESDTLHYEEHGCTCFWRFFFLKLPLLIFFKITKLISKLWKLKVGFVYFFGNNRQA